MNLKQLFCSHEHKSGSPPSCAGLYAVDNGMVTVARYVCQRCEKVIHEAQEPFYGRYDENRPTKPTRKKKT